MRSMSGVEPFTVHADPAGLADLRSRLRATHWPDIPEDAGWSQGADLGYLRELVAHWAEQFDWPAQEAGLARLATEAVVGVAVVGSPVSGVVGPGHRRRPFCLVCAAQEINQLLMQPDVRGFSVAGNEHDVNRSARTGKFVKDNTVEREPSTTTTEHVGGGHSGEDREIRRSASTGKFVKEATVERHPETTETQQV